jgi:hypothetical protein
MGEAEETCAPTRRGYERRQRTVLLGRDAVGP